jgi:hypothetical protein
MYGSITEVYEILTKPILVYITKRAPQMLRKKFKENNSKKSTIGWALCERMYQTISNILRIIMRTTTITQYQQAQQVMDNVIVY